MLFLQGKLRTTTLIIALTLKKLDIFLPNESIYSEMLLIKESHFKMQLSNI
jgi:hypothetical protein